MFGPFAQNAEAATGQRVEDLSTLEAHRLSRQDMCLIISLANSLHFTFFAPSISRAKS